MRIRLIRLSKCTFQGTFGVLHVPGHDLFLTGELPWIGNKRMVSCIPGNHEYKVRWTYSPKFKRMMYIVKNVPNRSGIRIHSANWVGDAKYGLKSQVLGCITLGEKAGYLLGQKAVLASRHAVQRFEKAMAKSPFTLCIEDPWTENRK